jgi:hypothetical protein
MSNASILNLPNEMLETIFSHLDSDEVVTLTEVCQRFNEVIGFSPRLMSEFTINWRENGDKNRQSLLQSKRKYQRLNVSQALRISSDLQDFISKHSTTLCEINFTKCTFSSSEFGAVMRQLANSLKSLGMNELSFTVDSEVSPIKFSKLEQMNIMCDDGGSFCSIINFFTNSKNVKVSKNQQ